MPKGVYRRDRGTPVENSPKLTGLQRNPYSNLENIKTKEAAPSAIAEDEAIREAERATEVAIRDSVDDLEGEITRGEGKLQGMQVPKDPYESIGVDDETEIGNGGTIPFRYRGRPTQMFTTCSEPEPNKNRGCPFWFRCPLRNRGPYNLIFKDTESGQVRFELCSVFVQAGMIGNPQYKLLPGVDYFYSYDVKWAPLPNGQEPEPGPGKPKTHLVKTPVKNHMTHVPEADLVRQYQELRVRGEVR